jgi:predicted nucleic-acid-binding protein
MIGIDTNILVRFFVKDDLDQGRRAASLMRSLSLETPGFVSLVCLAELVWVLRSQYRLSIAELIRHLEQLLNSPELMLEGHAAVSQALRHFAGGKADFADCLIERSGHTAGCGETVTFDADASRFAGMRLL